MRHNVIRGKSDGGHLGFMQIRPLVLKNFCPPRKNITKYIAKFHEFIPMCTQEPKRLCPWTIRPSPLSESVCSELLYVELIQQTKERETIK